MKKLITASVVFLCLSLLNNPYSFGQDVKSDNDDQTEENAIEDSSKQCCDKHIAFGVELGLNISDLLYSQSNGGSPSKPLTGGRIGGIIDVPISNSFSIQPGIFYAMNGGEISANKIDTRLNTVEVPINVIYNFHLACCSSLFIGIGPFFGYNMSGTTSGGTVKILYDLKHDHAYTDKTTAIDALDYGVGGNIGYEFCKGLFLRARYQWGLANIFGESNGQTKVNSESYGLQVGYFFGRKCGQCKKDKTPKGRELPKAWEE